MTTERHAIGQLIERVSAFKDDDDVLADPTTVRFFYRHERMAVGAEFEYVYPTSPELTKESVGVYVAVLDLNVSGWWTWRWKSEGTPQTATEDGGFAVAGSVFVDA